MEAGLVGRIVKHPQMPRLLGVIAEEQRTDLGEPGVWVEWRKHAGEDLPPAIAAKHGCFFPVRDLGII